MDVLAERLALAGLQACGADDDDVLSELADELLLLLERLEGALASRLDCLEGLLGEREELRVFDAGSVSQPTATIAPVEPDTVTSTSPSEVVRSARLAAVAMPRSRSRTRAASRSPSVSTSARLTSIIPGAGLVAELLHE